MAEWGITTPGGLNTSIPPNWARAMGGTFDGGADQVLTGVSIYMEGSADLRLAVYQGGALATSPVGATLIWDAGLVNAPGAAGWVTTNHPGPYPSLTDSEPTWIAIKADSGSASVYYSVSSADSEDFQSDRGRWSSNQLSTDEDTAYPDPWTAPDGGSFGSAWFSLKISYGNDSIAPQSYYYRYNL